MRKNKTNLLNKVASYYTEKLEKHGDTPQGVDWNGGESQIVRFEQLCKIINPKMPRFSINDLGCGYGALLDYLHDYHASCTYLGVDISSEMIASANERYKEVPHTSFTEASEPDQQADFSVASGIFNVRLDRSSNEWRDHIENTLDILNRSSKIGFSFNCLTSYSDEDKKRDYLYYADPCQLFDLCKRKYSRQVALLHDYGLYEFTILIRK